VTGPSAILERNTSNLAISLSPAVANVAPVRQLATHPNCALASTCDKTSQSWASHCRADVWKNTFFNGLYDFGVLAYSLLLVGDHFCPKGTAASICPTGWRRVLRKESVVKKPILPLAMGLFLLVTPSLAAAQPGESDITPLSNKDVLVMVQQRLSEEAIVTAIKSSPCTFDTFPPVLKDMKRRGVPDAVLQAMIQAPYGPSLRNLTSKDELGEQPIYHYADQLRQMGYITPSTASRSNQFPRQSRARASRNRRQ
jgi:hypothetical protein